MARGQTNRQKDVARVLRDRSTKCRKEPARKVLAGLNRGLYNKNPI